VRAASRAAPRTVRAHAPQRRAPPRAPAGRRRAATVSLTRIRPMGPRLSACVRRRYPLADDLAALFARQCPTGKGGGVAALTVVGHTRFATGSANKLPELHPHDWGASGYRGENRSFEIETIWRWDPAAAALAPVALPFGLHLTHNGDFDALEMYAGISLNEEVGLWLERALHASNSTTGDSPKMAGLVALLRVQGRWGPAARMAWLRVVCKRMTDVSAGERLSKTAPNSCPADAQWQAWARLFEAVWATHGYAVAVPTADSAGGRYRIERAAVRALCADLRARLAEPAAREAVHAGAGEWSAETVGTFIHHAVRGFLVADLHAALAEALQRAHGSFGLQAHCTAEPGVVVLGCKGQPMGLAYSAEAPLVLFGSEAAALQVAVRADGLPLAVRMDLDEQGETMRVGPPCARADDRYSAAGVRQPAAAVGLELAGGLVEIRAYSLHRACEASRAELGARGWAIGDATPRFDPAADLVGRDIGETPAVLASIDAEWSRSDSPTRAAATALCAHLLERMEVRREARLDTVDLLIGGVEVSLWLAQQLAADMRALFPALTVKCVSTNKLLGVSGFSPRRTFFAGNERASAAQLENAAILLVSQSGQTFPSLHAARLLSQLAPDRVWLLTGTPASKMEAALVSARLARGEPTDSPRVLLSLSGHRPAEPSSLAVAATHHTMTHLLLHMATHVRNHAPESRIRQSWEVEEAAMAQLSSARLAERSGRESGRAPQLATTAVGKAASAEGAPARARRGTDGVPRRGHDDGSLLVRASDGCLADMRMMVAVAAGNVAQLAGVDARGKPLPPSEAREALLAQGRAWAAHVREPWIVLVLAASYILLSLVLGIPVVALLARLALRAAAVTDANLSWSLDEPLATAGQHPGWTALGFIVRLADALIYVFLGKLLTWGARLTHGRPLWARHGKRTVVIVETATNHQMLEAFVSKLFSQAYSVVALDVHGAAGVDHFVHRFTHRVARGVLIAVGRPDGRLCCLAKTEASLILACKQAAFIQNPAYDMTPNSGNAPEIVSVGHNPFKPAGVVEHVPLSSASRRRFVDELVYERLHRVQGELTCKPTRILGTVTTRMIDELTKHSYRSLASTALQGIEASVLYHVFKDLPFGAHFIPREDRTRAIVGPPAARLIEVIRKSSLLLPADEDVQPGSDDPNVRLAFATKLDARTHEVQDRQLVLQQFYECRVAALERYIAFCVMFHTMAAESARPWLLHPWNIARSQSNLRVATTASPVSASDTVDDADMIHSEARVRLRAMATKLRGGMVTHF
jgi:hypothetical protein